MKLYNINQFFVLLIVLAASTVLLPPSTASAKLRVVTTTPDFAAIAEEIGGDRILVESLSKGYQDPHFVDAKPNFILKLNKADLMIYNGLGLEVGWLPTLLTGSRNSKIAQTGALGNLDASTLIPNLLEIPATQIDRSMGDIHPGGNPHYMLDPRNALPVAHGIASRLAQIDPEGKELYQANYTRFVKELKLKINEWQQQLEPYKGSNVVTYHKLWAYFTDWAELKEIGFIEPKPGIPPSASHVSRLIKVIEQSNVGLILAANYYPEKTPRIIAEKTGAVFLALPVMVGGRDGINTYTELFDTIVDEIASSGINPTEAIDSKGSESTK